jgi:alpha-galactosidase
MCTVARPQTHQVWLDTLDLSAMTQDWESPQKDKSVGGTPITIAKQKYDHGVGTHANSFMLVDLKGATGVFYSTVGIDDETMGKGKVRFKITIDGHMVVNTDPIAGGDEPQKVSASFTNAHRMVLQVSAVGDGIDFDHADWANASFDLSSNSQDPTSKKAASEPPMSIYMGGRTKPEINGARIVGTTPGRPFLFKIPATGQGPLRYEASPLPDGVQLDKVTGILSGSVSIEGTYKVHVRVYGPVGSDKRDLTIVAGEHKLALTPPMGWNSWNVWGTSVTADKVKAAADSFVSQDLVDYGYKSVNIDDAWEGKRDAEGNIQTNQKFGDMHALADYVHSKGILLGIYSSPGPTTCAGYAATYQHEQQDADSYAKWGIDYLKYDWCSYGSIAPKNPTLADYQAPYVKMRACLDNCSRDIVFSFCQYGMGDVWNWGKSIGGNLWRTTGDITDNYGSMSTIAFAQGDAAHVNGAGPGGWNDPDMLVVGNLGWGDHPHPTHLTPNEQITHITMWSLLAAPLILGCDLTHLDNWTKALITNHDVIEIDQDPLGKPARRVFSNEGGVEIWARPLEDGSTAVGLMNRDVASQKITATWQQLGLTGSHKVKDLWQRKDIGTRGKEISAEVPAHGAVLFRIY